MLGGLPGSQFSPGSLRSKSKLLGTSLAMSNWEQGEVLFRNSVNEARILVTGIARITCLNANNERVTVALIAPGPIPELPSLSMNRFDFRCEAYSRYPRLEGLRTGHAERPRIGIQEISSKRPEILVPIVSAHRWITQPRSPRTSCARDARFIRGFWHRRRSRHIADDIVQP
jgi:hypothetical protein